MAMIVAHEPMALSASPVRKVAMRTEKGEGAASMASKVARMCEWVISFPMPDPLHRLCALVTGLDDRVRDAVEAASGFTGVAPGALATIGHAPGLRVEDLASMLRVSHSGAVRTVDRLVAAGLVERRPSAGDRRTVELWLTPAGGRARRRVLDARNGVLGDAVGVLAPGDRETLAGWWTAC